VVIKKAVLYPRISCASLLTPKAELHLPATFLTYYIHTLLKTSILKM
jgi:hypothetical protein